MDGLDAIKDLAVRAGKFQAELDEMGCGDPLKKENAELRRQLTICQDELIEARDAFVQFDYDKIQEEVDLLRRENKRLRKRMIGMVPLGRS